MYDTPNILLIDDNEIDSFITKSIFIDNGFSKRIETSYTISDALDYLNRSRKKPHSWPTLILINLNMPGSGAHDFLLRLEEFPEFIANNCLIFILIDPAKKGSQLPQCTQKRVTGYLEKPLLNLDLKRISNQISEINER